MASPLESKIMATTLAQKIKKIAKIFLIVIIVSAVVAGAILFIKYKKSSIVAKQKADAESKIVLPKCLLLTDGAGVKDGGFNASAWEGILKYYGDLGKTDTWKMRSYDTICCATEDQQEDALRQNSTGKFDLIIATGFDFLFTVEKVSKDFPSQKYALIDTVCHSSNVMSFVFTEEQGSFLVGVAAALKAKMDNITSPKFGFIGGESGMTIFKFEVGYFAGVHEIFPNAPRFVWYSEDWDAPAEARKKAQDWYNNGVYCIFAAAGNTGIGMIEESANERVANKNVWSIGVDVDQFKYGTYGSGYSSVLTSMEKRVDNAVIYALRAVENKTFRGEVVSLSMRDGGVSYSKSNMVLDKAICAELDKYGEKIKSNELYIPATYKEALQKGLINFDFPHCRYDK